MRIHRLAMVLAALATLAAATSTDLRAAEREGPARLPPTRTATDAEEAYGGLRLHFEANRGQTDERVAFLARGSGYTAFFTGAEAVFSPADAGNAVRMRFDGANADARPTAREPMAGRSHYFIGDDPANWVRDVPHHGRVVVDALYPGVELHWRGLERGRLEYDLIVAPGARPGAISMSFEGALGLRVDGDGTLRIETPAGELRHGAPSVYQYVAGERVAVPGRFMVRGGGRVGFEVGRHDGALPLVIDPVIKYSTFLGGSGGEHPWAMDVDGSGALVVGGSVAGGSTDFPTKAAFQSTHASVTNGADAFVSKINASGSALVFSTFLGGSAPDRVHGVRFDSKGAVYAAGKTGSSDFPTKSPRQGTFGGGGSGRPAEDAWIAKLSSSGSSLVFSTYHGGTGFDSTMPGCLDVDSSDAAYITGWTHSTDFPVKSALQSTKGTTSQSTDTFVSKFSATGALVYSTYYGGGTGVSGQGFPRIAVNSKGAAHVTAWDFATSGGFPTKNPLQASSSGGYDAVVFKINPSGSAIDWATYLGGGGDDKPSAIAVDSKGDVYVTGETKSSDFPTKGTLDGSLSGTTDAFVTKIKSDGSSIVYSGYVGGGGDEAGNGIAVDGNGIAHVVGRTTSTDFPTQSPLIGGSAYSGGTEDAFLSKVKADGSALVESTYIGGNARDVAEAVAVDKSGAAYTAGETRSTDFPIKGGVDSTISQKEVWITKTGPVAPPPAPTELTVTASTDQQVDLAWTDESSDETGFELERKTGTGAFEALADVDTDVTTYADTSVTGDTTYTYRVRAENDVGPSGWSNEVVVVTIASPDQLSGSAVSNTRVDLMWSDRTASEDGFEVERKRVGDTDYLPVDSVAADVTSLADDTVEPETTYHYRVRATKGAGASGWSNVAEVTTPPADPEDVIPNTRSDTEVRISWKDLSGAETGYEIERGVGCPAASFARIATVGPDVVEYTDRSASPETTYSYRVRAVNDHGASEYTAPVCITTAPIAPSGFVGDATSPSRIRLSWTDNSGIEKGYEVQRTPAGREDWAQVADLPEDSTEYLDVGVSQEAAFSYRIRAYDANGRSRDVTVDNVLTPAALIVRSAKLTARKGKHTLVAKGEMDTGGTQVRLAGAATLWVGDAQIAIGEFAPVSRGKVLRYDEDGVRLDLKPHRKGASRVAFTLKVVGDVAADLDPDGELFLRFRSGAFDAMGVITLAGGQFNPKSGKGTWVDPELNLLSLSATPKRGSLKMKATFPPGDLPATAPEVAIILDIFEISFESAAFKPKGTKLILNRRLGSVRQRVTLDYRRGQLTVSVSGVTLQSYEPGTVLIPLAVSIGTTRLDDKPLMVASKKSLRY